MNHTVGIHFIKIVLLFVLGYSIVNYYRPFQYEIDFFDFGIADSGIGLVTFLIIYLLFTPPKKNKDKATGNAFAVLFVYFSQEIYCFFFPRLCRNI